LVTFRQFRVSGLVSPVKKSKHAFTNSEPETQNSEQFSNPQPRRNLSGLQANFAAARRRGKELRRIEPVVRVERAAHSRHRRQIRFAEKESDVGFFLQAHAVLAGDTAAEFD